MSFGTIFGDTTESQNGFDATYFIAFIIVVFLVLWFYMRKSLLLADPFNGLP